MWFSFGFICGGVICGLTGLALGLCASVDRLVTREPRADISEALRRSVPR